MKRTIIALAAVFTIAFTSCNNNSGQTDGASMTDSGTVNQTAGLVYTCPMHPEVISDKPGKCPECKMDLVEKTSAADSTTHDTSNHEGHSH